MKRAHRRWHRWAWLTLAPASAAVLALSLWWRSDWPANTDLPAPAAAPLQSASP
jgi:hypothetical protein